MKTLTWFLSLMVLATMVSCNQEGKKEEQTESVSTIPETATLEDFAVMELENVYGRANNSGNGAGVFRISAKDNPDPDSMARMHYRQYLGAKYTEATSSVWNKGFRKVFTRGGDSIHNFIREINTIPDPEVKKSLPLLLEFVEPVVRARQALAGAFNRKDANQLLVYTVGDGEAYAGLLITTRYEDGTGCTLIVMAD